MDDCGEFDRQRKSGANFVAGATDTLGDFFPTILQVRTPISFPGHSPCYVVARSYDQNGASTCASMLASLDVLGKT